MRRKLAVGSLALVALGAALAAAACLVLRPAPPGVTKTNFDRIALGTSRADIERLFGGAATSTSPNGRAWPAIAGIQGVRSPDGTVHEVWGGDDGAAIIQFDGAGLVVHKHWLDSPSGLIADALRALGL